VEKEGKSQEKPDLRHDPPIGFSSRGTRDRPCEMAFHLSASPFLGERGGGGRRPRAFHRDIARFRWTVFLNPSRVYGFDFWSKADCFLQGIFRRNCHRVAVILILSNKRLKSVKARYVKS